jgi:hypothetical protein
VSAPNFTTSGYPVAPPYPAPSGHRWVPKPDQSWHIIAGRPCQVREGHGPDCGMPSIGAKRGGPGLQHRWRFFCEQHTHQRGRWIGEDGSIMCWRLEATHDVTEVISGGEA